MKRFLTKDSTLALATWLLVVAGAGRYLAETAHHDQLGTDHVTNSVAETVVLYQEVECTPGATEGAGSCAGAGNTSAPALNIPLNLNRE